jgi:GH24 family phage-related lysozyme (muramidase)
MTYASVRAAAEHLARVGSVTPHQLAALQALDESLTDPQRQKFTELWRAQGSPAAAVPAGDPAWLAPATKIIQEFEGCHLQAYRCPAGIPTIGWGATRYSPPGGAVRMGDTITQARADELLRRDLLDLRGPGLLTLLPMAVNWPPNRIAALVSWAFNVGLGAVESSTLRRRLLAGEDPVKVANEELPRWNKADGRELAGLTRRRAAELALFVGHPPLQQTSGFGNPLQVPWYQQMDSADRAQAARMCFSSSCAMLLQYLKPGTLKGPNGDDQYLKRVQQYGDTTDPTAQIRALSSYGIRARFTKVAGWRTLEDQIAAGIPVPCGFLHRGPVTAPSGSGHWLIVVGYDRDHLIVHDPFGEADLVSGATIGGVARFASYSRRNFGPRWMVEGARTGWAIIAER